MNGFFTLDNAISICIGAWTLICPAYIIIKKKMGTHITYKFTTTEHKKKFKKYKMAFNEEFKKNKLFN